MFFCLTALFILQYFIAWLPIISVANLIFLGYIYATQFKIIFTSGNGYKEAPDFPEFDNTFDNILMPLVKMICIWLFAYLPLILTYCFLDAYSDLLHLGLLLVAYLYLPIGLMIAAMDSLEKAFNPRIILQSIQAAGGAYIAMVLAFFLMEIITVFFDETFPGSWILGSFVAAYGIMFTGRLIGCVYRDRIDEDLTIEIED